MTTKGIPPRKADRNSAGARVLDAMAKEHAKADAKQDLGSEAPAPPTGLHSAPRGGSAAGLGRAVIPARFAPKVGSPSPKAAGHVAPKAVSPHPARAHARRTP